MKKIFTLLFACITLLANAQSGLLNGTGYAPDITVTDINGNSHNLYSYLGSGKMVVLELMSTTCGHCQMYTSGTENSYQSYGPNGADVAEFIGLEVNSSTTDNDVANFATTYNVGFPICNNISPSAINYQLYYTPSYYVIYPDSSYTTICPMYCNDNSSYSTIEGLLNAAIQAGLPPVYGCTDASAINFDSTATVDDGTCDFTSYTITTVGMSFSPDTIICDVGDTINFILGGYHNAVEVTDSAWVAGGNTPIAGGFSFGYGTTGMYIPDDCHTFYYVCSPHAAYGMKGVIIAHHPPVWGCTDSLALNYDTLATVDDTSCTYICNEDAPTNLNATNIIQDRATVNWDNMNSISCTVDQYRIKYRAVGVSSWISKTMGAPVGSCTFGTNKTDKLLLNLNPNTTYEYQMKAWYCGGGNSVWTTLHNFTTLGECPNITNLQVSTPTTSKATFTWDTTTSYSFVRIKARIDVAGSTWFNVGGFGVNYPALTKNKNGLTPGTSYRAQARTWCNPSGGAYRSLLWTSPILWTQPAVIRLANPEVIERTLLKITDLLGREINPNKVIDKTTLFYIYNDGVVEKRIVVE